MKTYVLGAGVSKTVGYPLGSELFDEIDTFIKHCGPVWNRFNYMKDWPNLCSGLEANDNPLIAEAYRTRQLEQLFTVLDHASLLKEETFAEGFAALAEGTPNEIEQMGAAHKTFYRRIEEYDESRRILLWVLDAYLRHKHHADFATFVNSEWEPLGSFGAMINPGDIVITFNYDATVERVLYQQGKWSPRDGYGFELVFRKSELDSAPVDFERSGVTVLHLHGAVGWYPRPSFKESHRPALDGCGGAVSRDAITPAPLGTEISLDPLFLRELGIQAVDACLPRRSPNETTVLLHPSFFKNYELEGSSNAFIKLWRLAAEHIRSAEKVYIIGYSLPQADSAALTLLLTNCDPGKVHIVNRNKSASKRLRKLLSKAESWLANPISFEDWVRKESAGSVP